MLGVAIAPHKADSDSASRSHIEADLEPNISTGLGDAAETLNVRTPRITAVTTPVISPVELSLPNAPVPQVSSAPAKHLSPAAGLDAHTTKDRSKPAKLKPTGNAFKELNAFEELTRPHAPTVRCLTACTRSDPLLPFSSNQSCLHRARTRTHLRKVCFLSLSARFRPCADTCSDLWQHELLSLIDGATPAAQRTSVPANASVLNNYLAEISTEVDGWQPFEMFGENIEELEPELIVDKVDHN